ncbi:MAG TPA: S8 family serine peptidase [Niastella sp.]
MKGYSLHIGVNIVDPQHYGNISKLNAAVNDAKWWEQYAGKKGYTTTSLHNDKATIKAVKDKLHDYAIQMKPGDILLLTYSGHGGEIINEKPDNVDKEKMDQTWCLYDEQLLDDEIYECFQAFAEGTRIVVVADSCHSGTVVRAAENDLSKMLEEGMSAAKASRGMASRQLPEDVQNTIMSRHYEKKYEPKIKKYKGTGKRQGIKAAVKLLAACQDNQVTYDGDEYGIFTNALANQLNGSNAPIAEVLISGIKNYYVYPKPNFFEYGAIIPGFDKSMPFEIKIANPTTITGYRKPVLQPFKEIKGDDDFSTGNINRNAILVVDIKDRSLQNLAGGADVEVIDNKVTDQGQHLTLEMKSIPYLQGWSAAHALQTRLKQDGITATVEPVLSFNPDQLNGVSKASSGSSDYIPDWPPAQANPVVKIGWHLDAEHSQLKEAADKVAAKAGAHVRVGHIDTGYLEGHVGLPKNLATGKARSFVPKEPANQAIDKPETGMDGHGLGTMCLLAGNDVPLTATFNEFKGFIGGVPMAEVVPIRISNSVIIWNAANFCDAIDYALEQGCEVITMSMAGKPSPKMAKAVNRAYEAGVVIVSAASNCWYAGPMQIAPKCVLWPAAFERVIAATGAMYNHQPYDGDYLLKSKMDFTKYMQGCWGPPSRMRKALAAYTPNTPWASKGNIFARSGGGTSSATPQVAAAAALYIAWNREEMEARGFYKPGNKWKIVEAVRHALFTSAAKDEVFTDWKKYYGNGILRAAKALEVKVADEGALQRSAEAESAFGGFFQIAGAFFLNRRLFRDATTIKPDSAALTLELLQLLQIDNAFYERFSNLDLENEAAIQALFNDPEFTEQVIKSPYASDYLKQAMAR